MPWEEKGKAYSYKDMSWKDLEITLSGSLEEIAEQARSDYKKAFEYIQSQEYWIWRYALKRYHLSTYDRKHSWIKAWQSNITIWLIRSFIDVLTSVVQEKPLVFIWTAINEKWVDNKEYILKALNYVSDRTWFHKQIKKWLKNGLIFWEIAFRVWYMKYSKKQRYTTFIWSTPKEVEMVESLNIEEADFPYATSISVFKVFPDPYQWMLRNVTERDVVDHLMFKKIFMNLISSKQNKSPFKSEEFIKCLPNNENWNDTTDYWNTIQQVHQKKNEELRQNDKYNQYDKFTEAMSSSLNSSQTQDHDKDVVKWLIEYKYTVYEDRIVLHANWYPVYIGPNPFWFIPYVIKSATDEDARHGEWIPYLLNWIEEIGDSFVNNYVDWARHIATPQYIAVKNLLVNENQLKVWAPWTTIWAESLDAVKRFEKWGLQDFNMLGLVNQIAQQITGISEYTLGQSAWERTASWALAVVNSSNRRMSPYISNFVDAVSIVAQMWLSLMRKYWTKENWIYVNDENWVQTYDSIKNSQLMWWLNISLQAEWLFWTTNELEMQKLIAVYKTLAWSWFTNSPEIAKEIMKKAWFTPSRFIMPTEQLKPDNADQLMPPTTAFENWSFTEWQIAASWASPQMDNGNQGWWNW